MQNVPYDLDLSLQWQTSLLTLLIHFYSHTLHFNSRTILPKNLTHSSSDFAIPLFHFCYSHYTCSYTFCRSLNLDPIIFSQSSSSTIAPKTPNPGSLTFVGQLGTTGVKTIVPFGSITILHIVASEWSFWTTPWVYYTLFKALPNSWMWLETPLISCFSPVSLLSVSGLVSFPVLPRSPQDSHSFLKSTVSWLCFHPLWNYPS